MKAIWKLSTLGMAVALASHAAVAQEREYVEQAKPNQYIGGMAHYIDVDEDWQAGDRGAGGTIFYGRKLHDHVWWESEAGAYGLESNVDNGQDFYQYPVTTGLAFTLGDRTGFTPYLVMAVGGIYNDVYIDDDDGWDFHANAGLGAVTGPLFNNGLKVRAEARYLYNDFDGTGDSAGDGGFGDYRYSLGLEVPMGYTKVVEKTRVETKQVAVQQPVIDSDGDGVPDNLDQCPDTMPGAKVDGKGCLLVNQTVTFNNINFEFDSAELTASSRPLVSRIARSLTAENNNIRVEVAGHTDSVGSAQYNEGLSQRRADSVRNYLVREGVDSSRVTARGYGESQPIADNDSASGRAMNRRVEFHVTE
ncbi:OmpA family protein [Alloalcanivorax xenomutans]|uniref:OmpA family protein n=1 Tax=Alloalcanivorax xenomutans TaxID=1094342 RepID=UPI00292CC4CE|nr:OmpA family protein [Alloalcanivorax xenomutans]WOA29656.1 OmpA family protein [Alloalcanivorax xenomutans]